MGTEQDVLPDLSQALASLGRGSLVAKIERLEAEVVKLREENEWLKERNRVAP